MNILRVLLMASAIIFPRLLAAQDLDVDSLAGEYWYGLYMQGEKAGYAVNKVEINEDGSIAVIEDSRFRITMMDVKQEMHIYTKRTYAADGALISIDSMVVDPSGKSNFDAVIEGNTLILRKEMAGQVSETEMPAPQESLRDALRHSRWVKGGPQVGDTLNFTVFEPMYEAEVTGMSHIIDQEIRFLDGVETTVYKIKTSLDVMNIDSIAYVTAEGVTLEDEVAGMITMRLEPKDIAQDVDYSNDVIVSNAVPVEEPLENPRTREDLHLILHGPLTSDHFFNDARQEILPLEDGFYFFSHMTDMDAIEPVTMPIEEEDVTRWIRPSTFIQSDHPRLVEKAAEIVGDETDAFEISTRISNWVSENMTSTFSARLSNALEVLDSLEGDCTEHSVLFIGLARAAGIPAREVAGLVYVEGRNPGFYFHQWAKVWVGEWIDVDPTFNQPLADVTHIKLAEGDLFRQARLLPVIGRLDIDVLDVPPENLPEESAAEPETDTVADVEAEVAVEADIGANGQ